MGCFSDFNSAGFDDGYVPESESGGMKALFEAQEYLGEQIVYDWADVRDEIYSATPVEGNIESVCDELIKRGVLKSGNKFYQQKGNDCATMGTTQAVGTRQKRMALAKAEIVPFDSHPTWIYALYHCMIQSKRGGSGGCSMGQMLAAIAKYGVLPMDEDVPSYAEAIGRWNTNPPVFAQIYEKYKVRAVALRVKVAEVPRKAEDIIATCRSGRSVAFGTAIRCAIRGEYWQAGGSWMHAMELDGWRNKNGVEEICLINSHGENRSGWVAPPTLKALMGGRYWDAFAVLDVTRGRKSAPDWSVR